MLIVCAIDLSICAQYASRGSTPATLTDGNMLGELSVKEWVEWVWWVRVRVGSGFIESS
jgi:hypothetical protein